MSTEEITKIDTTENPLPERVRHMVNVGKRLNAGKKTLRISPTIYILVKPENCNEEYAAKYRERMDMHDKDI